MTSNDDFLKLFTMGVTNQRACFVCPYRNSSSADIRIGDYWGSRYEKSETGVSMVLVGTEVGQKFMNLIEDRSKLECHDISERLAQQHMDYKCPKYYDISLKKLRDANVDLRQIINLYETKIWRLKKKIKSIIKQLIL